MTIKQSVGLTCTFKVEYLTTNRVNLSNKNFAVKSLRESFVQAGRLDAEYYQEKYDNLRNHLSQKRNVKSIAEISTYNARGQQPDYFESGTLNVINSRHILEQHLDYDNFEKTSPNYWKLQPKAQVFRGDILIYTTGANIGRTNVYYSDEKALASNHVNILRIQGENPYYVGFVLNSIVGRLQTEKYSAGSAQAELYPKDIDQFLIPFVEEKIQIEICQKVEQSLELRKKSRKLLDIAKEGVEKAIEVNEAFATDWIESQLSELGVELKAGKVTLSQ